MGDDMCKEDVRIARKAGIGATYTGGFPNVKTKIFNANPNRYSISIFANFELGVQSGISLVMGPLINGVIYPVLVVSGDHPGDRLTIDDIGDVICETMYASGNGTGDEIAFTAIETQWTEPLESL